MAIAKSEVILLSASDVASSSGVQSLGGMLLSPLVVGGVARVDEGTVISGEGYKASARAVLVDVDGDGDDDIVYSVPFEVEEGAPDGLDLGTAGSWRLKLARSATDAKAGRCVAISSRMAEHNDVCLPE
jgi:hypothetical protein